MDFLEIHVAIRGQCGREILPPRDQEVLIDQTEPWGPFVTGIGFHHNSELIEIDIAMIARLLRIDLEGDAFLHEKNVIHFVFTPGPVMSRSSYIRGAVVQSREILKIFDAELM